MGRIDSALRRLKAIFANLEDEYSHDEWVLAHFQDVYLAPMKADEAFELLDTIAGDQELFENPATRYEFLVVVSDVARQTNTTEIPPRLIAIWPRLVQWADGGGSEGAGVLEQISAYYRMKV